MSKIWTEGNNSSDMKSFTTIQEDTPIRGQHCGNYMNSQKQDTGEHDSWRLRKVTYQPSSDSDIPTDLHPEENVETIINSYILHIHQTLHDCSNKLSQVKKDQDTLIQQHSSVRSSENILNSFINPYDNTKQSISQTKGKRNRKQSKIQVQNENQFALSNRNAPSVLTQPNLDIKEAKTIKRNSFDSIGEQSPTFRREKSNNYSKQNKQNESAYQIQLIDRKIAAITAQMKLIKPNREVMVVSKKPNKSNIRG